MRRVCVVQLNFQLKINLNRIRAPSPRGVYTLRHFDYKITGLDGEKGEKQLMRVKGHSGQQGNEEAQR